MLIYLIKKKEKKERFNEIKLTTRMIDWKMCRIKLCIKDFLPSLFSSRSIKFNLMIIFLSGN